MINLNEIFKNYNKASLECVTFEININNFKVANFYNIEEAQRYISMLSMDYNDISWYVKTDSTTFVFVFHNS